MLDSSPLIVFGTLRVPPIFVRNAQGTPLIDDNVTHLCYYTMYNIGPENVLFTLWVCNPLIHGIITNVCDIIIYKRGPLSVAHIEIQRDPREY